MARIVLEGLRKVFPGGAVGLHGLDLVVEDGERLVLVGPSGCGKSTTLRLVAGLERPSAGRILLDDRDVTALPPQRRDLAMVFQSYALYPHKTVRENLAFPLRMAGVARDERGRRVAEVAAQLELDGLLERRPAQLSGGQRQRVALGRALVRTPAAQLFDEPLSNLDARLRLRTRAELVRLQRRIGTTMLYVTHDQEEAMTVGQRIAVLNAGRLEQVGSPLDVYDRPATVFVAGFLGSPPMNLVPLQGELQGEGPRAVPVEAPPEAATLGIRPEDLDLVDPERADVDGVVDVVEVLGAVRIVHLVASGPPPLPLVASVPGDAPVREGERIGLRLRRERVHWFDSSGRRLGGR